MGMREPLRMAFRAALDAVHGRNAVRIALQDVSLEGPIQLVAVGKAGPAMAQGAVDVLRDAVARGLVLTKTGHCPDALPSPALSCRESAHPVPDARSLAAGEALLRFIESAPEGSGWLFLISGGTSSLVEVLPEGVGAEDLARLNRWLLGSGLDIHAMNRIRKAVSRIKAGRLAGFLRGRPALCLLISDVPGDDPRSIGSGLLARHEPDDLDLSGMALSPWLAALLRHAPPLPESGALDSVETRIVASNALARQAAADKARGMGLPIQMDPETLQGDALEVGRRLAKRIKAGPPGLYVWGGETTVRLPEHPGRGGRCQSLALAAALELRDVPGVSLLAAGTDGGDGPGEDAGAVVDGGTLARGEAGGLNARDCLARADTGTFLAASGDLIRTGPTGTNVMDLVLGYKAGSPPMGT